MPIYEYRCQDCGHKFEAMQRFSDAPITECPSCHAQQVKKLISNTSFQLKGSGWYVTDYGKGGSSASKPAESKGESKSETKTEAKAETKSDTSSSSDNASS